MFYRRILIFLLLLCPQFLAAQDTDSTYALPEIVVVDSGLPSNSQTASVRVTTVLLRDTPGLETNLASVLQQQAGVSIRNYGPGGLASVSVRGGTSSQLAVIYDGIQLVNPQLGEFDLSLFDLTGIESIQLVHGPGSAWYSSAGGSGVLSLQPSTASNSTYTARVSRGSFGTEAYGLTALYVSDAARFNFSVSSNGSDGDFRYLDETLFPATNVRRENAGRVSNELQLIGNFPTRRLPAFGIRLSNSKRDLPGNVGAISQGERQTDQQLLAWLSNSFRVGTLSSTVRSSWQRYRLRYINHLQSIEDDGVSNVFRFEQEIHQTIRAATLSGGYAISRMGVSHPSLNSEGAEWSGAIFLGGGIPVSGSTLMSSVRTDIYRFIDGRNWEIVSPRIGVNVPVRSEGKLILKSSVGRSSTVPTFNDRFWSSVGATGNQDLVPERGWSWDMGAYSKQRFVTAELNIFTAWKTNQIEWRPEASGVWAPSNIGSVLNRGVESSIEIKGTRNRMASYLKLMYNYVAAKDRTNPDSQTYNKQLRYVPVHSGSLSGKVAVKGSQLTMTSHYAGKRYSTSDESAALRGYMAFNVEASHIVDTNRGLARLLFAADNVFNSSFVFVQGYPMPLRSYRAGLILTLRNDK